MNIKIFAKYIFIYGLCTMNIYIDANYFVVHTCGTAYGTSVQLSGSACDSLMLGTPPPKT